MEMMSIGGLTLYYDKPEQEAAGLIGQACRETIQLLEDRWGLAQPEHCRVYVMTSWSRFLFHASTWPRRIIYALLYPFVAIRHAQMWKMAGGWNFPQGKRMSVGVKPPRLLDIDNSAIGRQIFLTGETREDKARHVTCHELTHAFTAHLMLPVWLHEGLAMAAVDRFFGRPTVRPETVSRLERPASATRRREEQIDLKQQQAVVDLYVQAYWRVRYLDQEHPELLKRLLAKRRTHTEIERLLANGLEANLGSDLASARDVLDQKVVAAFKPVGDAA